MVKLGDFLREVSNWTYDEFVRAEKDPKYSANQSIVFGLVRACTVQKLPAIQLALNRLDGKLKTPVKIELPKIYYLYPNAKVRANSADLSGESRVTKESTMGLVPIKNEPDALEGDEDELLELGLRDTLSAMSDFPRNVPQDIVDAAQQVDASIRGHGPMPFNIPRVKSVIAANLLLMAQSRSLDAIYEVFDHIDGKLVETIEVLGEDLFITSYIEEAPEGAYLNEDGIMQLEATSAQTSWDAKWGIKG